MIVDMHRHLWSIYQRYPRAAELAARGGMSLSSVEKLPLVPDWEEAGQKFVAELDEAGVDKSVLFLADYGLRMGEGVFSVYGENLINAELARRYPERIIPYFGIDPRRPGAAEAFEQAVKEQGVKGLKLHPAVGYFPHDRVVYPLYEICVSHGLPVTLHCGPMPSPLLSRYTQPLQFDDVAADFPQLTMILAHAGQELWPEALSVARTKPNIYLELSMWQSRIKFIDEFVFAIARMRDTIGIERILWGSDFPGLRRAMSLKEWVGVFRRLPALGGEYGHPFDDKDVDAILGGNAGRILGLSSGPHHQDSGEAKIRESTAGVSRKPSSDGKARGCSSKHLCGLTAWNT